MANIHILTEGGTNIGFGHVSRCSALYDEAVKSGHRVNFVINDIATEVALLENRKFKTENWMTEEYLNQNISKDDYVVIDSYLAEKPLYDLVADLSKKALYIDDTGRIEYPKGIILNPALDVSHIDYPSSKDTTLLSGPEYVILREPFNCIKQERILNEEIKRVLITLGGANQGDLLLLLIEGICNKRPEIQFDIILGSAEKIKEINKAVDKTSGMNNISFHSKLNAAEMMGLMLNSDLAITAAGQTIYELIATQKPFIAIQTVDNQSNNIIGIRKYIGDDTIVQCWGPNVKAEIVNGFEIASKHEFRRMLYMKMDKLIDGLGTKRIIDKLIV